MSAHSAAAPWPSLHNKSFRAVPVPFGAHAFATPNADVVKAQSVLDEIFVAHTVSKFTFPRFDVEKFLLENNIQTEIVTQNIRPVSAEALLAVRKSFIAELSDYQLASALGCKISIKVLADGDQPLSVKAASWEPVSLNQALITSNGVVLGAKDSYSGKCLKFIFQSLLGFSVVCELPEPLNINWNDYLPAAGNLVFIGTSTSTSDEAIRTIMRGDAFGSATVAVVRDLFDRNPARPSLGSVLSFLNQDIALVSPSVAGRDNLHRRLVTEYHREGAAFVEKIVDMELVEYLKYRGFEVLVPSASEDVNLQSVLQLGQGHVAFLSSPALAEWVRGQTKLTKHPLAIHANTHVISSDALNATSIWLLRTPATILAHEVPESSAISWQFKPFFNTLTDSNKLDQSTHKILMVSPVGFISNPQTLVDNHFMKTMPDLEVSQVERRALEEASNFHKELVKDGVQVYLNCNEKYYGTPDALFPNNWFSTHNSAEMGGAPSTLVLYPMKAPARRAERRNHMVQALMAKYEKVITMTSWEESGVAGIFLEGTGSLVLDRVRRVAYCLISQRADKDVFLQWCKLTGYAPVPFHAHDKNGLVIYHTNVMMAIGTSVAVLCADSIRDPEERRNVINHLEKHHHIVYITLEQMEQFCGNVLEIRGDAGAKKMLVMSDRAYEGFTPEQRADMLKHVDKLFHVAIPTIEDIGGGGVRCMMGELF